MTLRFLVSYDGTEMSGYAAQPGRDTVQGSLEQALSDLAHEPVKLAAAGRTDAGVHALGQVVSTESVGELGPDEILRALAGKVRKDVGILDAAWAPDGWSARFDANWRAYTYLIWNDATPHPLYGRFTTWLSRDVDERKLREALRFVVGKHDFTSFAKLRPGQLPVRDVLEATCQREGPLVRVRIVARSFLHQMVRSIVGSSLEVASGRRPVSWMGEALMARTRAAAGPVAPARGLTLVDVGYGPEITWTRRRPVSWPWSGEASGMLPGAEGCSS